MHVLMDTTVATVDRAGVGRYIDEIAHALSERDLDLTLVCHQRDVEHYRRSVPRARLIAAPRAIDRRPVRLLWEQTVLPLLIRRSGADVVLSPHYTMPLLSPRPVVVTLHDATFFTHPEVHERSKRYFFRFWTRTSLRRARGVLTPSQATRAELIRLLGQRAEHVVVAPLGVNAAQFHLPSPEETHSIRRLLGLSQPYVAFLGTIEPRKNLESLIRGWVELCAGREVPPALVLAGKEGWGPSLDAAASEVPPGLVLLRPGYLPLEALAGFLGGAEVVVYPSLGEGFGLPVLEAMSCGAAVLTTGRLSLPEVGGDVVAYCEPDPSSIASGLRRLLDEPGELDRLRAGATARASLFSWAACAKTHHEVFESATHGT